MRLGDWWRRYLKWRLRHVVEIVSDNVGLRVGDIVLTWEKILKITAFKRDLLTVDLLCLFIEASNGAVEVNEEMAGYERFEAELSIALGLGAEWKLAVLFPAFATNATVIFERPLVQ